MLLQERGGRGDEGVVDADVVSVVAADIVEAPPLLPLVFCFLKSLANSFF